MAETLKKDRGLFDGVLLASDYDGTLVPDTKIVTPGVKKALQFFEENGRALHGMHRTVLSGLSFVFPRHHQRARAAGQRRHGV